jgi:hypothetical protein
MKTPDWIGRVALILLMIVAGCGSQATEEIPEATDTPAPAGLQGRCGDGVCDTVEQSNPSLCPQDCGVTKEPPTETALPPGPTPEAAGIGGKCGDGICDEAEQAVPAFCPADCAAAGEGEPEPDDEPGGDSEPQCETEEWTLTIEGCSTWKNMEPSAELCAAFVGGFTVHESCRIRGTGSGRYKNCAFTSPTGACSYEMQCPEFQMGISGEAVWAEGITETLRIKVDSSGIFESGTMTCLGQSKPLDGIAVLQTGIASATRNGGDYFCDVEVPEGIDSYAVAVRGQDAVALADLTYDFIANVFPGTVEFSWEDFDIETE